MDISREQFEDWIGERGWGTQKTNGFYDDPRTHDAWSSWNASRNAIEISLPFLYPFYRQEVCEVLGALGLKVKPYGN